MKDVLNNKPAGSTSVCNHRLVSLMFVVRYFIPLCPPTKTDLGFTILGLDANGDPLTHTVEKDAEGNLTTYTQVTDGSKDFTCFGGETHLSDDGTTTIDSFVQMQQTTDLAEQLGQVIESGDATNIKFRFEQRVHLFCSSKINEPNKRTSPCRDGFGVPRLKTGVQQLARQKTPHSNRLHFTPVFNPGTPHGIRVEDQTLASRLVKYFGSAEPVFRQTA